MEKGTVTVSYEVDDGAPPDYQEMDYHSKDIAWIKAPRKVEAKPEPEPKPAEAKPEETVKANYHFAEMKKAILDKKPASLESLLKKGADINGRDDDGFTPLMWAAASGNEECTKLLIKKHAPLESKDKQGSTALLNAAGMGAVMTVKMLLDKGADMAARDERVYGIAQSSKKWPPHRLQAARRPL